MSSLALIMSSDRTLSLSGTILRRADRALVDACIDPLREAADAAARLTDDARQQARQIVADAHADAQRLREAAEREAGEIRRQAHARATLETAHLRQRMLQSLESDVARCVLACLGALAEGDSAGWFTGLLVERVRRACGEVAVLRVVLHPAQAQALSACTGPDGAPWPLEQPLIHTDPAQPLGACTAITPSGSVTMRLSDLTAWLQAAGDMPPATAKAMATRAQAAASGLDTEAEAETRIEAEAEAEADGLAAWPDVGGSTEGRS